MNNTDNLNIFIKNQNLSFSNDLIYNRNSISNDNLIDIGKNNIIGRNSNLDPLIILDNSLENSGKKLIYLEENNKEDNKKNKTSLNNLYISIDSKNIFTKLNENNINEMNKKIKKRYYQNDESSEKIRQLSNAIRTNLLEYLIPKKADYFQICLYISKQFKKKKLLENIEKNIEYFFTKRVYFKYAEKIKIDKNITYNLGLILCYIYNNLNKYKIKDFESFNKTIVEVRNKKIDVLNDFFIYCNNNDLKPEDINKYEYFENVKKKYMLEPELIFLINVFNLVQMIEIDFDFEGELFNLNEFSLFFIVIININYLLNDLNDIKLNLINRNLLYGIYGVNNLRLFNETKYNLFFKKNKIIFNNNIYTEKWDFDQDFILENYRELKTEKTFYYKDIKIPEIKPNIDEISIKSKNSIKINNIFKHNFSFISNNIDNNNYEKLRRKTLTFSSNNLSMNKNIEKENNIIEFFKDIVNDNINILEMILITLFSLDYFQNLKKIELILNESYFYECCSYFRNSSKINIGNSHIFDFIYNKLIKINSLSLEINSFDLITFNRMLKILYNNNNLLSFKCSLFSSDCTYFPQAIHKTNNQNIINKFIKINQNDNINDLNFRSEEKFFRNIYNTYERNLKHFFEIIKLKKKLKILGFNFDIPFPILNDEKYIIIIIKFILNILLLCIDNDSDSIIEELIILSPYLVINGYKFLFFDKLLDNIHNNKCLIKLNIQMKLYNIINIHKLISERLKILNIGDFDLFSLKIFVENITNYNFCKISSLEEIGISLNKTIFKLDEDVKLIIAKLFNIKILNLSSINLYSNIEINKNEEFKEIISLLNNNWTPSYLFLINDKSNNIINNNSKLIKTVNYITRKTNNKNKKNENENQLDNTNEIFRCLKLLLNKGNGLKLDFFSKKNIISKILRYLYVSKPATISFKLEKDKKYDMYFL